MVEAETQLSLPVLPRDGCAFGILGVTWPHVVSFTLSAMRVGYIYFGGLLRILKICVFGYLTIALNTYVLLKYNKKILLIQFIHIFYSFYWMPMVSAYKFGIKWWADTYMFLAFSGTYSLEGKTGHQQAVYVRLLIICIKPQVTKWQW